MKKILLFLVVAMFVGKMSVGEWEKINQEEFMRFVGVTLCNDLDCEVADIGAKKLAETYIFSGNALTPSLAMRLSPLKKLKRKRWIFKMSFTPKCSGQRPPIHRRSLSGEAVFLFGN